MDEMQLMIIQVVTDRGGSFTSMRRVPYSLLKSIYDEIVEFKSDGRTDEEIFFTEDPSRELIYNFFTSVWNTESLTEKLTKIITTGNCVSEQEEGLIIVIKI